MLLARASIRTRIRGALGQVLLRNGTERIYREWEGQGHDAGLNRLRFRLNKGRAAVSCAVGQSNTILFRPACISIRTVFVAPLASV